MAQSIKGTFSSGASAGVGQTSAELVIPSGVTTARLTVPNNAISTIDASNTVKTQRSLNNGVTWADQTTYNSAQSSTAITVAHGEQWRLSLVAQQAFKSMDYTLSCES